MKICFTTMCSKTFSQKKIKMCLLIVFDIFSENKNDSLLMVFMVDGGTITNISFDACLIIPQRRTVVICGCALCVRNAQSPHDYVSACAGYDGAMTVRCDFDDWPTHGSAL